MSIAKGLAACMHSLLCLPLQPAAARPPGGHRELPPACGAVSPRGHICAAVKGGSAARGAWQSTCKLPPTNTRILRLRPAGSWDGMPIADSIAAALHPHKRAMQQRLLYLEPDLHTALRLDCAFSLEPSGMKGYSRRKKSGALLQLLAIIGLSHDH